MSVVVAEDMEAEEDMTAVAEEAEDMEAEEDMTEVAEEAEDMEAEVDTIAEEAEEEDTIVAAEAEDTKIAAVDMEAEVEDVEAEEDTRVGTIIESICRFIRVYNSFIRSMTRTFNLHFSNSLFFYIKYQVVEEEDTLAEEAEEEDMRVDTVAEEVSFDWLNQTSR